MEKKGQVTVFIILGIIIVALGAGFFVIRSTLSKDALPAAEIQHNRVQLFVESCLKQVGTEGLTLIGAQGGYYQLLNRDILFTAFTPIIDIYVNATVEELNVVRGRTFSIPYYFYQGESYVPDENIIKQELTAYIQENLASCIDDFALFTKQGIMITGKPYTAAVQFRNDQVHFELDYPLRITDSEQTVVKELRAFSVDYGLDFKRLLDVIAAVVQRQEKNSNSLIVADLAILSDIYDFRYEVGSLDDRTTLYLLSFNQEKKEDYVFAYAALYDWENDLVFDDPYLNAEPVDYER